MRARIDLGILASWGLVTAGAVLLCLRFGSIPDPVPTFRSALGEPTHWAPKTLTSVLRVAAMGAGQLGAVTAMATDARASGLQGWTALWRLGALTAGAKTLFECLSMGLLGTASGATLMLPLQLATIAVVAALVLAGAVLWRRGALGQLGRVRPAAWVVVGVSLCAWLAFATWPKWGAA